MQETRIKEQIPLFTTERFYPEHAFKHGLKSLIRHTNRYKWAASHLEKNDLVLDAGCGSGYGDHILLKKCRYVIGVDKSEEAIEYAIRKANKVKQSNLFYRNSDLQDMSKTLSEIMFYKTGDGGTDKVFDAVVCIEVIEHLNEEEQKLFLDLVTKTLKPTGTLLITTPHKNIEKPMTEHHVHEFDKDEFTFFLMSYFKEIRFDIPRKFGIPDDFMLAVCNGVNR